MGYGPLAAQLGLRPPCPQGVKSRMCSPRRGSHQDLCGGGHHSHRLSVSHWASPWTPKLNCREDEWATLYIQHILQSDLSGDLVSLQGITLACDCPWDQMCEADLLAPGNASRYPTSGWLPACGASAPRGAGTGRCPAVESGGVGASFFWGITFGSPRWRT